MGHKSSKQRMQSGYYGQQGGFYPQQQPFYGQQPQRAYGGYGQGGYGGYGGMGGGAGAMPSYQSRVVPEQPSYYGGGAPSMYRYRAPEESSRAIYESQMQQPMYEEYQRYDYAPQYGEERYVEETYATEPAAGRAPSAYRGRMDKMKGSMQTGAGKLFRKPEMVYKGETTKALGEQQIQAAKGFGTSSRVVTPPSAGTVSRQPTGSSAYTTRSIPVEEAQAISPGVEQRGGYERGYEQQPEAYMTEFTSVRTVEIPLEGRRFLACRCLLI